AFRFERGVDFAQAQRALDRATNLILEICAGVPGPVSEARAALPARDPVALRLDRVARMLGFDLDASAAAAILRRLGFDTDAVGRAFAATPPSYRFDIGIEEDLIEELARIHGYDNIPAAVPVARAHVQPAPESRRSRSVIRDRLVCRGYHEVVTYSF